MQKYLEYNSLAQQTTISTTRY